MSMLSVVLPAYNEEEMLLKTASTLKEILCDEGISYQLVFVDDGSKDATWEKIKTAKENDPNITGVYFSRNFGKESAVFAGLANAKGDCVAVMDCDLQHPPETLVEMYRLWEDGYEIVEGVKKSRGKESAFHRFSAGTFYNLMSRATKIDMSRASDFKLMDRKVVDTLLAMPEKNTFFRAMSSWVGFKSVQVEFDVREREAGESKWSTRSLIKYAITNIAEYSSAPMQIITGAGIVCLILSCLLILQLIIGLILGHTIGAAFAVILVVLLVGSFIMIGMGILGYYLAEMYEEVKGRPRYIISKII